MREIIKLSMTEVLELAGRKLAEQRLPAGRVYTLSTQHMIAVQDGRANVVEVEFQFEEKPNVSG